MHALDAAVDYPSSTKSSSDGGDGSERSAQCPRVTASQNEVANHE